MAQTKIEQGLLKFTEATDYLKIPTGTTAQRPSSPVNGYIRFNTTINDVEAYNGTEWTRMGIAPPTFSSVDYPGSATALDPAGGESLVINGTNFNTGITITIDGTTPSSITLNSSTQLTVTTPAKTAGTYDIVFTNTDGGTATASNAVSYNGIPAFTNAAGSLGAFKSGVSVSVSAGATEPDGGAITHTVSAGSLPSGLSLNATTGAITGTAPDVSASTTSSFTITATDNENQSTSRAYSIQIDPVLPSDDFNAVTYTGNGSSQTITVGFQPDLVWIKSRTDAYDNNLLDSTRGDWILTTNKTVAQEVGNSGVVITSNGFTVDESAAGTTDQEVNKTNSNYIAWCFKANGGTTSSNTDGSATSTVQANTDAGFSIVTFNHAISSTTYSYGHGLGVKPDIIILKMLNGTSNWFVYYSGFGATKKLELNQTIAESSSGAWASTEPTTSVFSVNNVNAGNWVAYCFHQVDSFSKFGSYTGNGSDDGPIVETGFEPAFLMIKRTDSTGDWRILDNKRSLTNPRNEVLKPNSSEAEESDSPSLKVDFLSNGFQLKSTHSSGNTNNATYIYMAFAADPDTTSPTLADSFNTVTYTGNGGTQSITGLGFKPNMVWIKNRSTTASHLLHDSVRGTGSTKTLFPNNTPTQGSLTSYGWIDSFDNDGFTVNASSNGHHSNRNGNSYVAWAWKADDNEPTINTNGSINSIVSANANAGFSIVSYTGNGSQGATVAHGLGSAPDMIIIKDLSSTEVWLVGNSESGWTKAMHLNLTNADNASNLYWNDTAPTSTVFSIGAFGTNYNVSGNHYIAYCFKSTSGFSKIGSYTGNGGSNSITGLGFQPDFVMIKSLGSGSWFLYDSQRTVSVGDNAGTANARPYILANTDGKENGATSTNVNLDSNGFSMNTSAGDLNTNGTTYIYMAFKIN